jgi:hypothetical protein
VIARCALGPLQVRYTLWSITASRVAGGPVPTGHGGLSWLNHPCDSLTEYLVSQQALLIETSSRVSAPFDVLANHID